MATSEAFKKVKAQVKANPPVAHLIIEARAGTGKTTTLVEGLKVMKGIPSKLTPSRQQAAVWEEMAKSKAVKTVAFVAFNKSIATELQNRVPQGCDAMTMHSMGFKAITKVAGRVEVSSFCVSDIIAELLETDIRELRKVRPAVLKATEELVNLCKMNLVGVDADTDWDTELNELASYYDVDLNGSRETVFNLVPKVLEECKNLTRGRIDFSDMIWLPVVLNLPVFQYDLLLVDEAQDLNRCQQALAKKAGRRLILCGDPKQAIYGFAGADAQSMNRMAEELGNTPAGCLILPLTVTRRCGKAIVAEACRIVPDFEAFETNPDGQILQAFFPEGQKDSGQLSSGVPQPRGLREGEQDYTKMVAEGDMIICRVNAPLVSQCFKFIRQGRKANIQGRDVGRGLISTVEKMKAKNVTALVSKLSDWLHAETKKEEAKRNPSEQRIIALQDKHDCILCFTEGCETVEEVTEKIEAVFTDDRSGVGIKLSSIHKAKGLEADNVFFLMPDGGQCPHPMARSEWQRGQEYNLLYVGITRAKYTLTYVR